MSKFNDKLKPRTTTNLAGGAAYKQNPKLELVSILLTSFANDSYYEGSNDTFDRLKKLIAEVDPLFAAKAAIYARKEFGMRSITHVLAGELAPHLSGQKYAKQFYNAIINRPDDMMEIVAYLNKSKQKIPAAIKKGFALAFQRFDGYQIAKYKGEGKGVRLVDVANVITGKKPDAIHNQFVSELARGTLKAPKTWEKQLTQAGQTAENEEEKKTLKKEAWSDLIKTGKISYFALLRNLRNIMEQAPEVESEAIKLLTDRNKIKKSLVLPFRYWSAYQEIEMLPNNRNMLVAINDAAEIALDNVPKLEGKTLIAVDVSSSMNSMGESKSPSNIARMFGAILYKKLDSMLLTFDGSARFISLNPRDSLMSLLKSIPFHGGSTYFPAIFQVTTTKFDRIIILSDMQSWVNTNSYYSISNRYGRVEAMEALKEYKSRTGADPIVYNFDLKNYGSMQFAENKVHCLAGFSDKVFDVMKLLESDKNALINTIENYEF